MEQTPVENPVDVDLFNNLHNDTEIQTHTNVKHTQQDAVIRKLLHPPSAVPEFAGLPTNDARSQVVVEWRNMDLMDAPRVINYKTGTPTYLQVIEATNEDLSTFDYGFFIPNGARVKHIGMVRNNTAPDKRMYQDYAGVAIEKLYNFRNWVEDVNLYRPIGKSTTFYLNATMFNNTGMVVGNQFNPNILFAGTLLGLAFERPQLFYAMVKSMYQHKQISTTRDSNCIEKWLNFPHYHRVEILKHLNLNPTDHLNLDPNTNHQIINLGRISTEPGIVNFPTSSQILGNSMRSYGGKALEGAFSVQRLNTIAPQWLASGNTRAAVDTSEITGLYQCWRAELQGSDDDYILTPFHENADVGVLESSLRALYDTLWSKDMTWSYVFFSGLSLNPQTGSATSKQLLIKKTYSIYEVQPNLSSAWAGMVRLGPKPDLTTMQAVMDGFFELKDVMPARYNFWGTIASLAANGLKTFGTGLLTNLAKDIFSRDPNTGEQKQQPTGNNKQKSKRQNGKASTKDDKVSKLERQIQALTDSIGKMASTKGMGNNRKPVQPSRQRRGRSRRSKSTVNTQRSKSVNFNKA